MSVHVETLRGAAMAPYLPDLARLRIAVFAEYPYLYDGDAAYEAEYLAEFAAEPGSVLVAATDNGRIVGAATASPMAGQKPDIRDPFTAAGYEVGALFYFGESVLLPEYRGQGVGHAFFDHREAAAREAGARQATFASVIRPEDHPARPAGHRPHDVFWSGRGYRPIDLTMALAWKEHGQAGETVKQLRYWLGTLD